MRSEENVFSKNRKQFVLLLCNISLVDHFRVYDFTLLRLNFKSHPQLYLL